MHNDLARWRAAYRAGQDALLQIDPATGWPVWQRGSVAPLVFFKAYCAAGGLMLDPTFWRLDAGAEAYVQGVIEQALTTGCGIDRALTREIYEGRMHDFVCEPYGQWQVAGEQHDAIVQFFVHELNRASRAPSSVMP